MKYYQERSWLDGIAQKINKDEEMSAVGDHCDLRFSVIFGDTRFDLHFDMGQVTDVVEGHRIDHAVDFAFRAPTHVWDEFLQDKPKAFYQNIYSMLQREPEFHLDGDGLIFAQNARAMQRIMEIFQEQAQ